MSLTKKVFFNTSAQFVGKIINTVLGLISVAIITRYLGVAGYGNYTTAFAYIMFFTVISDFGFFWVIVRKISTGEQTEKVVQAAQSLRLIFAAIVISVSLILVNFLPYSQELKLALILVSLSIVWSGQNSVYLALFQSKMRMDKAVMAETGGRIVSLALVLLAVYLKSGFIWVVAAGIASTFFNYLFNLFFSFRFSKFGYSFNWSEMKEIFRESLPIGVITILSLIYFKIDTVLLSLFKPSVDVGIYGTAYKILEILMALPGMFVGSIFPALSEAFSRENFERLIVIMQKSFDALSVASFGIGAFFFGLAKPTINLVAGKDYIQTSTINFAGYAITSDKVLQILIIAVVFSFWSNLFTNSLITFKKQKELIKPYIAATIFNVSANLILIPKFSYLATAIITVLTELIILIYTYILVKKLAQINLKLSVFLKCSFAGFLVLVVTYLGKEANFYIMILVSATIYLLTLIGLKVISRETVKGLIRR